MSKRDPTQVTRAEFVAATDKLEKQLQVGFANLQNCIAASGLRIVCIYVGGLAVAAAILLALN